MKGWVYVITTQTHTYVKVGYTDRDPEARAQELSSTASPDEHEVQYAVLVEDARALESRVHKKLADMLHSKEWFTCSVTHAIATIRHCAGAAILFEEHKGLDHDELNRHSHRMTRIYNTFITLLLASVLNGFIAYFVLGSPVLWHWSLLMISGIFVGMIVEFLLIALVGGREQTARD